MKNECLTAFILIKQAQVIFTSIGVLLMLLLPLVKATLQYSTEGHRLSVYCRQSRCKQSAREVKMKILKRYALHFFPLVRATFQYSILIIQ
jgi:hypothetical protein